MINKTPFHKLLKDLKDSGKYRVFNNIVREKGEFPNAIWYGRFTIKNIVNWCSNDYLGMGQHKAVIDAMHTALDQLAQARVALETLAALAVITLH